MKVKYVADKAKRNNARSHARSVLNDDQSSAHKRYESTLRQQKLREKLNLSHLEVHDTQELFSAEMVKAKQFKTKRNSDQHLAPRSNLPLADMLE